MRHAKKEYVYNFGNNTGQGANGMNQLAQKSINNVGGGGGKRRGNGELTFRAAKKIKEDGRVDRRHSVFYTLV